MTTPQRPLTDVTALVTGGSRGIGRACCVALAERGAKVLIGYRSRSDAAESAAEVIREAGGKAVLAPFDVSDEAAVSEAVPALAKEHGLHIIVNNAGIAINGLLMRFSRDSWDRTIATNLSSMFFVAKAGSRALLRSGGKGRIINLASVVGESGNAGQSAYAASKAAIIGFTKSLAKELASRQVTVNAVSPGYIETDMTADELPEEAKARLLEAIPFARIGRPEDVAAAVAFLAGPEASYITGQVLRVNGGLLM